MASLNNYCILSVYWDRETLAVRIRAVIRQGAIFINHSGVCICIHIYKMTGIVDVSLDIKKILFTLDFTSSLKKKEI